MGDEAGADYTWNYALPDSRDETLRQVRRVFAPWRFVSDEISEIVPDEGERGRALYISSFEGPYLHEDLESLGIGRVLNVGGSHELHGMPAHYTLPDGVEGLSLTIDDEENAPIDTLFQQAISFISHGADGNGPARNTLIHCQAGISRSVTITVAYLVAERKMRLLDACTLVKQRRPLARPNPGFLAKLVDFAASRNAL